MKTLHILNGDATLNIFKQTSISGDVLVWREILADGPVAHNNLWELRANWIQQTFGEQPSVYMQKVVDEAKKLNDLEKYTELVLWFEYDLVCQINLTYMLNILNSNPHNPPIYLICPDHFPNRPNFRGLGELNPQELEQLYPTKTALSKADLSLASSAWDLYVTNDRNQIEAFLNHDFGNLVLLQKALKAHLLRLPKGEKQLSYLEETLLDLAKIYQGNKPAIYEAFWQQAPIFGLTDLQIDLILAKLEKIDLLTKN